MKLTRRTIKAALVSAAMLVAGGAPMQASALESNDGKQAIDAVVQINPTTVELRLNDGNRVTFDFYGDNIFRLFQDNSGGIVRDPKPMQGYPDAQILVENPRKAIEGLNVKENDKTYTIATAKIEITVCKATGLMKVKNLVTGKIAFEEAAPVIFKNAKTTVTLKTGEG